jgi:hypothetical protein
MAFCMSLRKGVTPRLRGASFLSTLPKIKRMPRLISLARPCAKRSLMQTGFCISLLAPIHGLRRRAATGCRPDFVTMLQRLRRKVCRLALGDCPFEKIGFVPCGIAGSGHMPVGDCGH